MHQFRRDLCITPLFSVTEMQTCADSGGELHCRKPSPRYACQSNTIFSKIRLISERKRKGQDILTLLLCKEYD